MAELVEKTIRTAPSVDNIEVVIHNDLSNPVETSIQTRLSGPSQSVHQRTAGLPEGGIITIVSVMMTRRQLLSRSPIPDTA
jgi:hypothetical protein